ncbi:MAG: hypothetical protein IKH07_08025 [Oscillospiraceae bacterium]|nr:hypothetical protein [Oscillospiraceae bacterium]
MKRILPILLILLLAFSACSSSNPSSSDTAATAQTTAVQTDAVQTDADQSSTAQPSDVPVVSSTKPEQTEPPEPVPVFPLKLMDTDSCALSVIDVGMDEIWGFTVKLSCENKSESTQLFSLDSASCRGWQLNTEWFTQVDAGETKESEFNVFPYYLDRCGLEQVDECRMHIRVLNDDSFSGELFADEELVFFPSGLNPEQVSPAPSRSAGTEDTVLLDNDQLRFSICGTETDSLMPYNLIVYYQNKTDEDLAFTWKDVTVNGTDANLWITKVLPAGLQGWTLIYFDENTMKNNGVTSIDTVDLTLVIKDPLTQEEFYSQSCSYQAINK